MQKEIKKFFKDNPTASIKPKELAKKLDMTTPEEYASLKEILHKLFKVGWLNKNGKRFLRPKSKPDKLIGVIKLSHDVNYGFVLLEDKSIGDVFIPERHLGTAFDGDTVEVELFARKRGKSAEGKVIDVVGRSRDEIVGTLRKSKSFYFVEPDERTIHRDVYISPDNLGNAVDGDKVTVTNIEWTDAHLNPEGEISEVLGKAGSYDAEIASIAKEMGLTFKFPQKVLDQSDKIENKISDEEIKKRLDLRDEVIVTIDPDDAKDFDDAVSLKKLENGNYEIGIHIADVSHYVRKRTPIYDEALSRGNSVYLVAKVIPMIPEKLSNNICSLVPNEDRLTYSVLAEITPLGKIISYDIRKSVINSKRRFTYKEVQQIIDAGQGEFFDLLHHLNKLAKTLRRKRTQIGSINFHTPEVEFKLNERGVPLNIQIKVLLESHNLIEEFMLLANQIIAGHIILTRDDLAGNFVYRIHDLPDQEKLEEFASFVRSLGFSFNPKAAGKSKQFQKLLEQVEGTDEEAVINEVAIRSMAKAVYSTNNIGHYGLAFDNYTHFTSPIRRFADLVVHILTFEFIESGNITSFTQTELEEICEHISAQERKAINAERLSVKLKQIEYLQNKKGEQFPGIISGITNFGIFVELNENLAEGLVRLSNIENDFYIFDEKNHSLVGRDTGKRYRLGDKVCVKLVRADKERRIIDFEIIEK